MIKRTDFAFIHPIWLSGGGVAYFIAIAMLPAAGTRLFPLLWAALVLTLLAWAHGIYRATLDQSRRREWVFLTAQAVTIPAAALMMVPGQDAPHPLLAGAQGLAVIVVVPLFFFSLWLSASALSSHQKADRSSSTAHKVGYFIAMVYWMFGAWFLWPKIRRLKAVSNDGAEE